VVRKRASSRERGQRPNGGREREGREMKARELAKQKRTKRTSFGQLEIIGNLNQKEAATSISFSFASAL
jgi:hypothetical protein